MAHETRKATNKLLEMIEEGILDRDTVITACMKYMSEDDVADMCHANEFFERGRGGLDHAENDEDREDRDHRFAR